LSRTVLTGVLIFTFCALIRIGLVDRYGLEADEFFSLAMATGHSLEHPADRADPALGDYVEAQRATPPAAYSRYLKHEVPPSGLGRVVRAVFLSDTNPPLYYLLLYGWTRVLGTGDASLRLFSVLWSLACFPLIWSIAIRLGGRGAAVATCILFAVSPFGVFYSVNGRMYSLLLLCSVSTVWLTLRIWDRGPGAGRLALWVLAGVAGLLTHYFFLFLWLPVVFWLQLYPARFPRRLSGAGAILTALLVLPWYVHLPESLSLWRVTGYWLTLRPLDYQPIPRALLLPWSFLSVNTIWEGKRFLYWGYAGVFLLLAVAAIPKLMRSIFSPPRSLLWVWLLGPCLGLVVFDLVRGTYVSAVLRYAVAAMPAACLLVGLALESLQYRLRAMLIALIALLCLIGVSRLYYTDYQQYPEVAKLLSRQVNESDLILVHSIPSCVAGLARYLEQERTLKPGVGFASWVGQLGRRRVPADVEALATERKSIILVTTHTVGNPAPEQSWLDVNAKLVEMKQFHGTILRYFTPLNSTTFFGPPPSTAR
jgi:mannosyltransferase